MAETTTLATVRDNVAEDLGLYASVPTAGSAAANQIDVPGLADKSPDAERVRDAFVRLVTAADSEANWRRVLTFGYPTNTIVTVARNFVPAPAGGAGGDTAKFFFLLDLEEWKTLINEFLRRTFYEERYTLALVAAQQEYTLPTWIQSKGQLIRFTLRDKTAGVGAEEALSQFSVEEAANVVSLQLHGPPLDTTNYEIIVYARRFYGALSTEASTTTCPYPLLFAGVKVAAVHKIFSKYGERFKRVYNQEVLLAERDLAKAKFDWLPPLVAKDYAHEDPWIGPDWNLNFVTPSW